MNRQVTEKMLDKILSTAERYKLIEKGDKIVVAISGGPDSVCLLHALHSLSDKLDITLYAIHINHMARGSESDADQAYTAELCSKLGIPLQICSFNIRCIAAETGMSFEEAGREIRYREFDKYADLMGANKIAVAHNKNDQVETVLMHIIRGSGLAGLAGMEYKRGRIIRPMLDIDRQQIEEYCKIHRLEPRVDSTNLKSDFTRNRIRLELIPYIKDNFDADISASISRLSSLAACDNSYMEDCAAAALKICLQHKEERSIELSLIELQKLHPVLRNRVIRNSICLLKGSSKGIESVHIADVAKQVLKGRTGSVVQLSGCIHTKVLYKTLEIYVSEKNEKVSEAFDRPVEIPGTTRIYEAGINIEASLSNTLFDISIKACNSCKEEHTSLIQYFDYDQLHLGINIRNRREGDVFKPLGSNGTRKLKEYFIDSKIRRDLRYKIPLVACGNEIIWIIGCKISDKFKVTENTRNVLKLECKPENNAMEGIYDGGN